MAAPASFSSDFNPSSIDIINIVVEGALVVWNSYQWYFSFQPPQRFQCLHNHVGVTREDTEHWTKENDEMEQVDSIPGYCDELGQHMRVRFRPVILFPRISIICDHPLGPNTDPA